VGRVVSRHNAAYGYLPASIGAFSTPKEFIAILSGAGFSSISAQSLTFGSVILYTAVST
jgi:ubiquinone/menaquinone biosynthesis C-methylase UbiE